MTTLHWDRNNAIRPCNSTPRDKIFEFSKAVVWGVRASLVIVFNAYVEGRKRQAARLLANHYETHPQAIADSAVVARKIPRCGERSPRDETSGMLCVIKLVEPEPLRTAVKLLTSFLIGRSASGSWVVRDPDGLYGGLFISRTEAIRYAMFEGGHRSQAVIMVPGALEFNVSLTLPTPEDAPAEIARCVSRAIVQFDSQTANIENTLKRLIVQ
jgi:hypothetical protein